MREITNQEIAQLREKTTELKKAIKKITPGQRIRFHDWIYGKRHI